MGFPAGKLYVKEGICRLRDGPRHDHVFIAQVILVLYVALKVEDAFVIDGIMSQLQRGNLDVVIIYLVLDLCGSSSRLNVEEGVDCLRPPQIRVQLSMIGLSRLERRTGPFYMRIGGRK